MTAIHSVSGLLPPVAGSCARVRSARRITPCPTSALVGRRVDPAAGRDQPRAPRRAVPRRDAGVQPARARSAAPAARGRRRPHRPRAAHRRVPRAVRADRRDESVPVRVSRRSAASLPLHADADRSLRVAAVRAAARSHRSDRDGVGAAASGVDVVGRRGVHRRNPRARGAGPRPPAGPRRRDRRADQRAARSASAATGLRPRQPERATPAGCVASVSA